MTTPTGKPSLLSRSQSKPNAPSPTEAVSRLAGDNPKRWYRGARAALIASPPTRQASFARYLQWFLPVGLPTTAGWAPADRFDLYALYVYAYGGPAAWADLVAGRRVILGLRVETSTKANGGAGLYDDVFVVLVYDRKSASGQAWEFAGNTEPSWRYDAKNRTKSKPNPHALGKDVDGDGVADLGRIPEGTYEFARSHSAKYGNILRPKKTIVLERDSNHDGVFDAKDTVSAKLKANLGADDTLFHPGGNTITGSAGCQTMKPAVFKKFWSALGSQTSFRYVLVTVSTRG